MRVPAKQIEGQLQDVLRAWGMSDEHAATTAAVMVETDLRGVDSHGISMLPTYDKEFRAGRLNMRPVFKTLRDGPAMALVDSHHFGAAGYYSKIAADRGVIGMVTSATRGVSMVPTFGAEPVMGTNPIAFAAPTRRQPTFSLDMATTTVAAGKVKVYKLNHKPLPSGWVVDGDGKAITDETEAFGYVFDKPEGGITPLGGTRDAGSHKGYGLGVMVHILAGCLSGASFSPLRNRTQKPSDPHNIGHFFLAIDPRAFRGEGEFEADLDQVIDVLRGAKRADPNQPVLIPGDPEMATRADRLEHGVPVPDDLMTQLRAVAKSADVPFVLVP